MRPEQEPKPNDLVCEIPTQMYWKNILNYFKYNLRGFKDLSSHSIIVLAENTVCLVNLKLPKLHKKKLSSVRNFFTMFILTSKPMSHEAHKRLIWW